MTYDEIWANVQNIIKGSGIPLKPLVRNDDSLGVYVDAKGMPLWIWWKRQAKETEVEGGIFIEIFVRVGVSRSDTMETYYSADIRTSDSKEYLQKTMGEVFERYHNLLQSF